MTEKRTLTFHPFLRRLQRNNPTENAAPNKKRLFKKSLFFFAWFWVGIAASEVFLRLQPVGLAVHGVCTAVCVAFLFLCPLITYFIPKTAPVSGCLFTFSQSFVLYFSLLYEVFFESLYLVFTILNFTLTFYCLLFAMLLTVLENTEAPKKRQTLKQCGSALVFAYGIPVFIAMLLGVPSFAVRWLAFSFLMAGELVFPIVLILLSVCFFSLRPTYLTAQTLYQEGLPRKHEWEFVFALFFNTFWVLPAMIESTVYFFYRKKEKNLTHATHESAENENPTQEETPPAPPNP